MSVEDSDGAPDFGKRCMLYFNPNGGEGGPGTIGPLETDLGGRAFYVTIPDDEPIRSGFVFKGWSAEPDSSAAEYTSGEYGSVDTNPDYGSMDGEYYLWVVFAVWEESIPQLVFESDPSTDGVIEYVA